jgi:hypothetical protein
MRVLALLLVFSGLSLGAYVFYLKELSMTDLRRLLTQETASSRVRRDLLQIAEAERANIAINGDCISPEKLVSSNMLTMTTNERDGYSYSVKCSGVEFSVIARHAPASDGSSVRYPNLAVDQNMQFYEEY